MPAAEEGHEFGCWYPVGTDLNREALTRNLAAKRPQTLAMVNGIAAPDAGTAANPVPAASRPKVER